MFGIAAGSGRFGCDFIEAQGFNEGRGTTTAEKLGDPDSVEAQGLNRSRQ